MEKMKCETLTTNLQMSSRC